MLQRLGEVLAIEVARDLERAEALQMLGHELGVEQREAAALQPRHQMHQRDLAGVGLAAEHALAEERAAERDAVEAADQLAIQPGLDRVGVAHDVQLAAQVEDGVVDPGLPAAGRRLRAARHHILEGAVGGDLEGPLENRLPEAAGHVKIVERQDAARIRVDPIEMRVVPRFSHRENSDGIRPEQHLRRDARRTSAIRHGASSNNASLTQLAAVA